MRLLEGRDVGRVFQRNPDFIEPLQQHFFPEWWNLKRIAQAVFEGAHRDVYRLGDEIPPGTEMVVWLKTDKSFLVAPLKVTNLTLPEPAAARN